MQSVQKTVMKGISNKQPVRWNIVMFDIEDDDSPYRTVKKNLSEDKAFEALERLNRRSSRMVYGAHAIKHR